MSQRIAVVTGGSRGLGKSTVLALALAKEIDLRGVTVNSILPTATEGAGVSAKQVRP